MGRNGVQFWAGDDVVRLAGDRWEKTQLVSFEGLVTWAVRVPGIGLALCKEDKHELSILEILDNESQLTDISLAPLSDPVGAILFEGKVWIACFGVASQPGIAVVDPTTKTLEATYEFPYLNGDKHFVHNIYAFDWEGRKEIFAAVLGNPWANPVVPGKGLVRFDRDSSEFVANSSQDLHARAAAQQADGSVFVIMQNPPGTASGLARLEKQGEEFVISATASLPGCASCDGADVLLGNTPDTLFATDRAPQGSPGKLLHFTYADGAFENTGMWNTGEHPRYTTITADGDIVSCNRDDGTITTFKGLANNPSEANPTTTVDEAVPEVSFYIEYETECPPTNWLLYGGIAAVIVLPIAYFKAPAGLFSKSDDQDGGRPLQEQELS